jgi:hypothetical protein
MSIVQIVAATDAHARHLAAHLREADRVELGTRSPAQLRNLLLESVSISRWANVALLDGEVALMYGVAPTRENPRWGVPWLLGTDLMSKVRKQFIRTCRSEVELMHAHFTFLYNRVHDQNALAIRWLIWLGFVIDFSNPVETDSGTFLNFWRGNPHV